VTQDKGGYPSLSFTARRFQLAQLAEWVLPAVPSSASQPVNGCFSVTAALGKLTVAGAGQQMSLFAELAAVTVQGEGTVYIPARKLKALLAEAPEGDVTVAVKGSEAKVTAGSVSWQLRLPPPDGYIQLPELPQEFSPASRESLLTALKAVSHAMGKEDSRPSYRQVSIAESGGVMFACATDSSQLSRAPAPGFPLPLRVPGGVLSDLVKLLDKSAADDVEVAETAAHVVFRAGTVTLAALKTVHLFPDVDDLFFKKVAANDQELAVDRAELVQALRRVRVTANPLTSAVALIIDGAGERATVTVYSKDAGNNSAEQVISAKWSGGRQMLVVNGGALEAVLSAYPSPACTFRIGKDRGVQKSQVLLEDAEAQVTGILPQLAASQLGY
jgi:DNA polymerase III sliding clamp (beta) subunit (PCNA family)